MMRYDAGTQVRGGYYWNSRSWELATVAGAGGKLEGAQGDKFVRVPLPAIFVLAPLMGGAFALFLPFIGFAMPVYALVRRLLHAGTKAAADVAATVTPDWQPGEAYLSGKPGEEKKAAPEPEKKGEAGNLAALAKEIEERRGR